MKRVAEVGDCIISPSGYARILSAECRTAFSCEGAMPGLLICLRAEALCDKKVDCRYDKADENASMCAGKCGRLSFMSDNLQSQRSSATRR